MITQRLLAPSPSGQTEHLNLPWSCAVYSIVNWMVAFSDVEGIQVSSMLLLIDLVMVVVAFHAPYSCLCYCAL